MPKFNRPLLDFLDHRWVAPAVRLLEPLLRGKRRVMGLANPMFLDDVKVLILAQGGALFTVKSATGLSEPVEVRP